MAENGSGSDEQEQQLHFVLVHGAGHGAWCWYKIQPLLEASGHKVTCIDLKCSGIDLSHFNTIFSFDQYNEPLTTFISSLPPNQKVILVGHSASGENVTDVLYKFAEKIHMAIYVAAIMQKHASTRFSAHLSKCNQDTNNEQPPYNVYEFIYGLGPDQPPTGIRVKPELQRTTLYSISPIEDSTLGSMLLRPSPFRALRDVHFVEEPGADSVPRVFIRTLKDNFMDQETQDLMMNQWPPSKVFATQSDHSPFFSTPIELFGFLVEAAASIKHH